MTSSNCEKNSAEYPVNDCPEARGSTSTGGSKGRRLAPPSINIEGPSSQTMQVLSMQGSSRSFSGYSKGRRRRRWPMCHLHPNDCHCEQCPCPGLTAAAPYPYPFVDPYREQHLYRGLSNLGPGNHWAAPPLDPRVAARQAGKGVDCGRVMLGRPPPFHRPRPEPLVLVRVPRSAGRYPPRGERHTGLSPTVCWANAERGLPLPPGCQRNMLRAPPAPPSPSEPADPLGPYYQLQLYLEDVDEKTCSFPAAAAERAENLACATCARRREPPPEAEAKGKKRRREGAESESESRPAPAEAKEPESRPPADAADALARLIGPGLHGAHEDVAVGPGGPEAVDGHLGSAEAGEKTTSDELAVPPMATASRTVKSPTPSKAVLAGSRGSQGTLGRASRITARNSARASLSAKASASRGAASTRGAASAGALSAGGGGGPGGPPATSTTSVRPRPSGQLSRLDSAMPLPEVKKSTVSAKPPLDGIRESVTSAPTVEPQETTADPQ